MRYLREHPFGVVYTYIIFALKQIDPDCISLSNMVYTYIIFALNKCRDDVLFYLDVHSDSFISLLHNAHSGFSEKPLMSSSGHGQSYVRTEEDLDTAFKNAMEGSRGDVQEVIIEEFIDFESEFTLLTMTQQNGWPTLFCPPIGHVQKGGDYRES